MVYIAKSVNSNTKTTDWSHDQFKGQYQLLDFELATIVKVPTYSTPGRPKKNPESTGNLYFIEAVPFTYLDKVKLAKLKVGMFILATNDTNSEDLTMAAPLENKKSQQKVERGFRFLKSPEFLTSSVFLKKPERIEAWLRTRPRPSLRHVGSSWSSRV